MDDLSQSEGFPNVESLMDELFENSSTDNDHQVSCMDRKEQWALRLLRKWSTKNLDFITMLIKEDYQNSSVQTTLDEKLVESVDPEEILLNGGLPAVDSLLSNFLVGVRQNKCGKQYSADSLRQVVMAIQRYLRRHDRFVSLLTDPQFALLQASIALEAVDRLSNPTLRKSLKTEMAPITNDLLSSLWINNCLGFNHPQILVDTVILYLGLNLGLTSGHSLRNLNLGQNIFFKSSDNTSEVCVTYKAVVKTGSSPARSTEVDIPGTASDEMSLPYILSTYLSYRPGDAASDGPLFLQPCSKPSCSEWYTCMPMGKDSISKALKRISKRAGIPTDSLNGSKLKMAAAVRLTSFGHPQQVIKQLTGLSKSHYEKHLETSSKVELSNTSTKRPLEDVGTSSALPSPKQTKISQIEAILEPSEVTSYAAMATPSTVVSVPVNVMKLLEDILPQKIRVTSVMDGVFLNADLCNMITPLSVERLPPWLTENNSDRTGTNNSSSHVNFYQGFVIDMVNALCDRMDLEFTFDLSPDDRFGTFQDGKWNGVIGQLHRGEADLAGTALTVTSQRYDAVDFCHPFYTTTLCVLYLSGSGMPLFTLRDVLKSDLKVCTYYGGTYKQLTHQKNSVTTEIMERITSNGMIFNNLPDALNAMEKDPNIVLLIGREYAELTVRSKPHVFAMLETNRLVRHYAFATPKGSPLCGKFSRYIVELMEEGKVDELFQKWWFNRKKTHLEVDFMNAFS